MTQLRRDPIRGHWSIIAPGRTRRPDEYDVKVIKPTLEGQCPFCPGNEGMTPLEIDSVRPSPSEPDSPGWAVRVVPNQYPAIGAQDERHDTIPASELFRVRDGVGAHEIVIATPEHGRRASQFGVDQWDKVLAACQYRLQELARDRHVKQVMLFQNHGAGAGASRAHAHFQILALPMVSTALAHEVLNGRSYFNRKECCLFCDVLKSELGFGVRVVSEDDAFVSLAPWASRVPYELCIMPRSHRASFLDIGAPERHRLARHLRDILHRLEKLFGELPYNWVLHSVPVREHNPRIFHWHIEVIPRLGQMGGYELGSGGYINSTTPEAAAEDLRALAGD